MTRIKLCGLSRLADIDAANELRPDYVGFVFAPSRRQVTPEQAAALRERLAPGIRAVGVFVNEKPEQVAALVRGKVIDLVQLHGDEDADYLAALRRLCRAPVIRAVRVGEALPPLSPLSNKADFLLFDTLTKAGRGGTGETFNWALLEALDAGPYFLSGGLGPDNVAQAVQNLHPWAVDASSALETDGGKDPEKMRRFVEAVRRLEQ